MVDYKISELSELAFGDIAENDELAIVDTSSSTTKKIQFASLAGRYLATMVVNVGSGETYTEMQTALLAYAGTSAKSGVQIEFRLKTGETIDTPISLQFGDYSHFLISSVDATVNLGAGFDDTQNIATFTNCRPPIWGILVDAQNGARNGIWHKACYGQAGLPGGGVINIGVDANSDANNDYGDNPNGAGWFCYASVVEWPDIREGYDRINGAATQTTVTQGVWYEVASVTSADWSSIGGSATASVGDTFQATSTSADISALGTVYENIGGVFSGNIERGVSLTNSSLVRANYLDVRNTGTDADYSFGHGAIWLSRGSTFHGNHCVGDGSARFSRVARSKLSCRDSRAVGCDQVHWGFELAEINASDMNMSSSGTSTYPVVYVGGPTAASDSDIGQPQGGASVNIERPNFTGCLGTLVKADTLCRVVLDSDGMGSNITTRIVEARNGAQVAVNSLSANATAKYAATATTEALYAASGAKIIANNFHIITDEVSAPLTNLAVAKDGAEIVMDNNQTASSGIYSGSVASVSTGGKVWVGDIWYIGGSVDISSGGLTLPNGGTAIDHYEEGTWTPTLSDGTNAASLSIAAGRFTRIGNTVTITGRIVVSSLGSMTGTVRIGGFPYTSETNTFGGGSAVYGGGLNLSVVGALTLEIQGDRDYAIVRVWDLSAGTSTLVASEVSSTGDIRFQATYFV